MTHKIPLETITMSDCSLNTKCLYLAPEVQGKAPLQWGHRSPPPAVRGLRFFSPAFCLGLCLRSSFSVFNSVWTDGAAEVSVMLCQFIATEVWALCYAERDWLLHSLCCRVWLSFSLYITPIMGSPLLSGRAVFIAWLWAAAWVCFSGWFAFVFPSQCSFVPSATCNNIFSVLESVCSARGWELLEGAAALPILGRALAAGSHARRGSSASLLAWGGEQAAPAPLLGRAWVPSREESPGSGSTAVTSPRGWGLQKRSILLAVTAPSFGQPYGCSSPLSLPSLYPKPKWHPVLAGALGWAGL